MLVIGIILSLFGIGFFRWLLFTLAIYALPFFAGLTAGLAALHGGAGVIGALIVGVLAAGATLAIGQFAFASARTPTVRAAIALVYAAPAAVAGYQATFGLAGIGDSSGGWREAFAVVGAIAIGGAAWARVTVFVPPAPERGVGEGPGRPLSPTAASRDG